MAMNNMMLNMLMGQLRNKNPQGYQELQQMMNSGRSPDQCLNDLLASGRFSQQDLDNVQSYLNNNNNNGGVNPPKRF